MPLNIDVLTIIRVLSLIVMLALAAFTAAILIQQSRKNRVLEKVTNGIKQMLSEEHTANRLLEEEALQRSEGNRDKKKFLYRIDEMLVHSGVRKVASFMTTELFLTILAVLSTATLYVVFVTTGEMIFAVVAVVLVVMSIYAVLKILLIRNRTRTEDGILQFANMLENYSRTTDDIVSIFGKVAPYLEEPLKTAVTECYSEIKSTGDSRTAFARLDAKIGHRKFSELLQNIEICSRHETNYENVIKNNKEIIKTYLSEKAVRKQMANKAKMQIVVLISISGYVVSQINGLLDGNLMGYLLNDLGGKIILCYCLGVVLFSIWKCITMGQED